MIKFLLSRLAESIPVILFATILIFLLMHAVPGDPISIMASPEISQEAQERLRVKLGLDQPLPVQYVRWLIRALRGDLGMSARARVYVADEIASRMGNTLRLAGASLAIATVLGIPIGILAALKRNSIIDVISMVFAVIGFSLPTFWLGLIMIFIFSVKLGVLPAGGGSSARHLILPALTLGTVSTALYARMTRASLLEVLGRDYLRTARAKGLSEKRIVIIHALRNSLIPVVTVFTLQLGRLIGGAVVTEVVFAWPGIGQLMVSGILNRDFPMAQGTLLVASVAFIVANLLGDFLYSVLDPRIDVG